MNLKSIPIIINYKMEWIHDDNVYLVGQCKKSLTNNKFACFDLDDTLIKTKSGKKFPIDGDDWKFTYQTVPEKLKSLRENKYNIVIITNQAGLLKNTSKDGIEWWKLKIEKIVTALNIPVAIYVAVAKDYHRKPYPTFWKMVTDKKEVNFEKSFYCGDACGRKNDFSDTDLKFALNCGITFKLPENVFDGKKLNIPAVEYPIDFSELKPETPFTFTPVAHEMIILVGMMGSGKSTFVQKYLTLPNYVVINRDTFTTMKRCISECARSMGHAKSVVIDNTNPSVEARQNFITIAKTYQYTIRCIKFQIPLQLAKHNTCYRHYMSSGEISTIPDVAYNVYNKKYKEPTLDEGFSEIINIEFGIDLAKMNADYNLFFL